MSDTSRNEVDAAITSRRSIRAFLPTPIPEATVREILDVASRAPSGTNTQPWKVHVLTGDARRRLSDAITAAYDDPAERAQVSRRGQRLDESKPGSGLGLSIVVDLAALYGGSLVLGNAPIGGLRAELVLPGV